MHLLFFLDSLLCKECSEKFRELFPTGSTGWRTGSKDSLGYVFRNSSYGTLHCLGHFSLIWSQNCTSFVFLDSLL